MKILLVNNNTIHLSALSQTLAGHDVQIQTYQPGLKLNDYDKDLVILSGGGGEGQEINDVIDVNTYWYEDEMQFVRTTKKPVIGICMGFEVMAKAHGQDVPTLGKLIYETGTFEATKRGWQLLGRKNFSQSEAHSWHVPQAPKGFEVLAESENGIEIIFNPQRRQIGTQFHPELSGSLNMSQLFHTVLG